MLSICGRAARLKSVSSPRGHQSSSMKFRKPDYPRDWGACQVLGAHGLGAVPPGANTAALLGEAYSVLGHQIVAGVAGAGFQQRPAHSAVFAHIDREGTRLTELAQRANITPQAMGELVDDLELRGYVMRRPDPDDRRAKLITLTSTGTAAVEAALRTIAGIERRLNQQYGESRMSELRSILRGIIQDRGGGDGTS